MVIGSAQRDPSSIIFWLGVDPLQSLSKQSFYILPTCQGYRLGLSAFDSIFGQRLVMAATWGLATPQTHRKVKRYFVS